MLSHLQSRPRIRCTFRTPERGVSMVLVALYLRISTGRSLSLVMYAVILTYVLIKKSFYLSL